MPARKDIKTILLIGSGPIVIGQACEFDYAGTQAITALKEDGYRVILVNSNPATIMTDPGLADKVYIEPLTEPSLEAVIEKERPDALLPTMGGQTALNLSILLETSGFLASHGVEMIGANSKVIERAEDREKFRELMVEIGLDTPKSFMVRSLAEGMHILGEIELPAILRPSFTLGGTGGGIAYDMDDYKRILSEGLQASPSGSVLVEQSIAGWKEYEMEVVRDYKDNCIIVCAIENIDPMGIHTGDSITVAPTLSLTDKEYQKMREASFLVLRKIGVETGGSNVQFAIHPSTGAMVVIEMNPRVSRSSALASKATGFPIARVAAKLAVGYSLDELQNRITGNIPASFEPMLDYVVTKIPRFNFEKFIDGDTRLTTSMKSVGEVMSLGRTFEDSLQKALNSLDVGWVGLQSMKGQGKDALQESGKPHSDRILWVAEAFHNGASVDDVFAHSQIDKFFLSRIQQLVIDAQALQGVSLGDMDEETFWYYKERGFSDKDLASLLGAEEAGVRERRLLCGVRPVYRRVDTVAGEFESYTPYLYSVYERPVGGSLFCESDVSDKRKVIILGSGPNRIGQGVEFDYCCVHAVEAFQSEGIESIMINCNPETVSTDFDTADRLYFEPLTVEHVLSVVETERETGMLLGVVMQFGGQTPLKLARELEAAGVKLMGTPFSSIDAAEDREICKNMLDSLGVLQPEGGICSSIDGLLKEAERIGYPVMIRPSYVLGGRSMHRVWDSSALQRYGSETLKLAQNDGAGEVLIDHYLENAVEFDVDAVSDGRDVWVSGIVEHIEEAGVHSGDSACLIPDKSLTSSQRREIETTTINIAKKFEVVGMVNVQYALYKGRLYVLEVNPRASRTVPFVAKATGVAVARIGAQVLSGRRLSELGVLARGLSKAKRYSVKESVFPFMKFGKIDPQLGPEMRSTGEVMGTGESVEEAFLRAQEGAGIKLQKEGKVFVSLRDQDKTELALQVVKELLDLDFSIVATKGTRAFLQAHGIEVEQAKKISEGVNNIKDQIEQGNIAIILNTPSGSRSTSEAGVLRASALWANIPCATTLAWGAMLVKAVYYDRKNDRKIYALDE